MRQGIDMREVIQKTTSDVELDTLKKKGFKKVKVLDKAAIDRMISESVEQVVEARLSEATERERDTIRREAKAEVDAKLRDFRASEDRVNTKEEHLQELRQQLELREKDLTERLADSKAREVALEKRLEEKEAELAAREQDIKDAERRATETVATPAEASPSSEISELKATLQTLVESMKRGAISGGAADLASQTDAAAIEALIKRAGESSEAMESNLEKVDVQESTSKSVNSNLEKLKSLKKGN